MHTASTVCCAVTLPPVTERAVASADRIAVAFARVLRGAGLEVPVGSTISFAEALAAVGLDDRSAVYWAGHATLVRRPEDVETYDRAFGAFWLGTHHLDGETTPEPAIVTVGIDDELPSGPDDVVAGDREPPDLRVRWSPAEVLRHRDFAEYSASELAEARRLMADVRLAGALRRSRRHRPVRRSRGRPDLRRTVRRSLRAGGEPIARAFTAPSRRPRRVVIICDVSGSMEPYARALLRFVQAAVAGRGRVEAFALGTRITRITRELSSRDPDAALAAAARRVVDWSGGTRLGAGLRVFNDRWGTRGLARGAIVVIVSDGWDRGDPQLLAQEMGRLHRVTHRVVWVNPLKATAEYAPVARGMAAALPHVDDFVEGHSLAALEELALVIAGEPSRA